MNKAEKLDTNLSILILYGMLASAPALIVVCFVYYYGVDVPLWDQWELANIFYRSRTASLTFQDLFAQHNEHRIFSLRVMTLGLTYLLSSWNVKAELLLSCLIAILTFISLVFLVKASRPESTTAGTHLTGISIIASSFCLFSTVQYGNWLWGFQIAWFLITCLVVNAILCLALLNKTGKALYLVLAIGCCLLASFSSAHGLFTWLACIPLFLSHQIPSHQTRVRYLLLWLASFAICCVVYFIGYVKPPHHPDITVGFNQLSLFLIYCLNFVGGALGEGNNGIRPSLIGFVLTTLYLLLSLSIFKQSKWVQEAYLPWLSLGLFAWIFAALTTLGRAGFGPEQALATRYTTVSVLILISLMQLWRLTLSEGSFLRKSKIYLISSMVIAGSLTACFISGYLTVFQIADGLKSAHYQSKACLELAPYLEPSLADRCTQQLLYPTASHVADRVEKLRSVGLAPDLKQELALNHVQATSVQGYLDGHQKVRIDNQLKTQFYGWATSRTPDTWLVIAQPIVLLKAEDSDRFFAMGVANEQRTDVAEALGSNAYLRSGWTITLPEQAMPRGDKRVIAYVYDPNNDSISRLNGESVLISKED